MYICGYVCGCLDGEDSCGRAARLVCQDTFDHWELIENVWIGLVVWYWMIAFDFIIILFVVITFEYYVIVQATLGAFLRLININFLYISMINC